MSPTINPTTKIVLVTGANQGIGLEVVRQLSVMKDHHILLGSRNAQKGADAAASLQKDAPEGTTLPITPITIDVTSDDSISAAASKVKAEFGRLDVLINNAGISSEDESTNATPREVWNSVFNTNVFGAQIVTEAFITLLSLSSSPRIVYVSSNLGSIGWLLNPKNEYAGTLLPAYRSSKAALNMIAAYYANSYREKGWKVNTVCPGYTATNLNAFAGFQSVKDAAVVVVDKATLGDDGPTATFSDMHGEIAW